MDKIPMTADGFQRLEDELKHLRLNERPAVIRQIAEAREHGDLSENAEYHAARERQSFIEGRVAELEDKIARAEVIDVSKLSGKQVKFGATITVVDRTPRKRTATRSSAPTRPTSAPSACPSRRRWPAPSSARRSATPSR